ncbi:MAG: DUF1329 domain-containing protein [Halioglobus sp.]
MIFNSGIKKLEDKSRVSLLHFLLGFCLVASAAANAEIPELGDPELTPVGAERQANAAGTIPAWKDGITTPPADYTVGERLVNPYPDDKILFKITSANVDQHAAHLSEGQKKLLSEHPDSWYMNVYVSRRTASYPQYVYKALQKNQQEALLIEDGRGAVQKSVVTSPFPVPSNGLEAIWNHNLRWRGIHVSRIDGTAAVTRRGNYTLILQEDEWAIPYAREHAGDFQVDHPNLLMAVRKRVIAPGFVSGNGLLTLDSINHNQTPRENWLYSPDLRRVLRAPFSGFDNPAPNSDGLRYTDEADMFNGSPGVFDWKLLGKREMYIPYNAYKLHSGELKDEDILGSRHVNPEHLRYELHRVWVVEGLVKTAKGERGHKYSKRVFYIDEDSWQIALADNYDSAGNLWRFSEGHMINYYQVPVPWYSMMLYYDFKQRRYLVNGLDNQRRATKFDNDFNPRLFGPNALDYSVR